MAPPALALRVPTAAGWLLSACLVGLPAVAFDEFGDDASPTNFQLRSGSFTLTLKGEIELELHDLEGRGGPGYDSPTDTRTIGTRSPFVEIDAFRLAPRLGLPAGIQVNALVELTMRDARVAAVWMDWAGQGPAWLQHHVELGYDTPIVAIDRRTERYPLIASAYWREPEIHATWEGTARVAARVRLGLGLSLAMMRPLEAIGVQESTSQAGTINVLTYGAARTFSGNGAVGGGRVRIEALCFFLEGFGFVGRLASEAGTDALRSVFPNYRDLPGADDDGFAWYGGRVGLSVGPLSALLEATGSQEGAIRRWGLYGQASYAFALRPGRALLHTLETLVRYEAYRIIGSTVVQGSGRALRSTAPINAVSWDMDLLTVALIAAVYRDLVRLRLELYLVWEANGVPGLGVADVPFRNNEILAQAEVRF